MRVYKCDLCRRTYSEYDGKQYSHVSLDTDGFQEGFDCCPVCTKVIVDVMSALQNGDEVHIQVMPKGENK